MRSWESARYVTRERCDFTDEVVLQNFQDECEAKLKVLEEAAASSQKMTYHQDADEQVARFKVRWTDVHETVKEWVARMTTLVECWNKLDGNVGELSSWVTAKVHPPPQIS